MDNECGVKATAERCWIENLHLTPCPQFQLKDGKKMLKVGFDLQHLSGKCFTQAPKLKEFPARQVGSELREQSWSPSVDHPCSLSLSRPLSAVTLTVKGSKQTSDLSCKALSNFINVSSDQEGK